MARDYGRKPPKAAHKNISAKILLVLASFLGGYLTASLFDFSSLSTLINKKFLNYSKKTPPVLQAKKAEPKIKPKFEFYTLLSKDSNHLVPVKEPVRGKEIPGEMLASKLTDGASLQANQGAKPAVVEAKPIPIPVIKPFNKKSETFLVQVAAFNRRQDAEQLKASLVLTGYDVTLSPILKNSVTWFRVIIGPFSSQGQAEKARLTVAQSHKMNGMVKRA